MSEDARRRSTSVWIIGVITGAAESQFLTAALVVFAVGGGTMDEHESSSGIIIGGAVVIVIVLLGVFGFGFVWLQRDEAGAAARPAPVLVAEPAAGAPMPPPDLEAAPAEARAVDLNERKLVGTWEAQTLDGSQATIEFRADHTFHLTAKFPDKAAPSQSTGRWKLQAEENGPGLKLERSIDKGPSRTVDVRFLDEDRLVIEGPGGATYKRRAK
jgi:hypothetical protein